MGRIRTLLTAEVTVRRKKPVKDEYKGSAEIYFKFTGAGGDDSKERSQETQPPGLEPSGVSRSVPQKCRYIGFEVITAVTMKSVVFCVIT
jgi:hypothetical protein